MNSSGAVALFVWLVICFSQLRMRKIIKAEAPEKLVVKMWLYPYLTWATAALIVFILGYMLTDTEHDGRQTIVLSLIVAALVLVVAFVKERVGGGRRAAAADAAQAQAQTQAQDDSRDEVSAG